MVASCYPLQPESRCIKDSLQRFLLLSSHLMRKTNGVQTRLASDNQVMLMLAPLVQCNDLFTTLAVENVPII